MLLLEHPPYLKVYMNKVANSGRGRKPICPICANGFANGDEVIDQFFGKKMIRMHKACFHRYCEMVKKYADSETIKLE